MGRNFEFSTNAGVCVFFLSVYRAVAKGYELFRIRYPGLMHYHHTKAGMWGNKDKKQRR